MDFVLNLPNTDYTPITQNDVTEIYKYLNSEKLYPDEIYVDTDYMKIADELLISITWGDWKHEHWRCDYLMSEIGYHLVRTEVTEDDGSDTYSANRIYQRN